MPGHLYPKCATPMPPAIIPVNKNRAVVHVVWGIQTIVRRGGILPKGGVVDKIDRYNYVIFFYFFFSPLLFVFR